MVQWVRCGWYLNLWQPPYPLFRGDTGIKRERRSRVCLCVFYKMCSVWINTKVDCGAALLHNTHGWTARGFQTAAETQRAERGEDSRRCHIGYVKQNHSPEMWQKRSSGIESIGDHHGLTEWPHRRQFCSAQIISRIFFYKNTHFAFL